MKVMVIDDEPIVAKGLRSLIDWESLGFTWLKPAHNGIAALERIDNEQPDLMIIDCKMPHMSGIELLTTLRQRQLRTKSIFLSGFDEFQLVQQAIRLGASEYMLKPPDINKLVETVCRLREDWAEEQRARKQMEDNLPLLRDRFLRGLLDGAQLNDTAFMEKNRYLNLPLQTGAFIAALISIETNPDYPKTFSYEEQQLMNFALQNITCESLELYPSLTTTWDGGQRLAILITGEHVFLPALRDDLRQLCENIRLTLKCHVNIGVSQIQHDLNANGSIAHREASTALEYKYYTGPNEVIFLDDIDWEVSGAAGDRHAVHVPVHFEKLQNALKLGMPDEMEQWLELFASDLKARDYPIMHTKSIGLQTVIFAYQVLSEMHAKYQFNDLLTPASINAVMSSESVHDMTEKVRQCLRYVLQHTIGLRKSGKNPSVEKAKQYIAYHYATNISLEKLAKETHLSPVYVSFLFKQVESMTISDYVTHVRVEKAKQLLKSTSYHISEIANQVGYQDERYFSRIFKKKTGFTPSEYKQVKAEPPYS